VPLDQSIEVLPHRISPAVGDREGLTNVGFSEGFDAAGDALGLAAGVGEQLLGRLLLAGLQTLKAGLLLVQPS
jgi:hypothetical protein